MLNLAACAAKPTALGRPLIAWQMVKAAKEHGATAVAHGCTGKGNDQVRFDVSFQTLAPHLKIIAPVREWKFTRTEELEYAKELSIEQNTVDLLGKVRHALARIESGGYGVCESCGKAIPVERLEALPYATLCVDCAAKAR